ncbi:MAG: DUF192 domain-containing protein [Candidatus Sungbacteria bacterium]|nr:DUF192 domain-containing protein [Candidatus Sungbacteria bacterium]
MKKQSQQNNNTSSTLEIRGKKITVELADTSEKTQRGLSGRETLGENEGMLFLFTRPGKFSFWMKDMHFALDIIWIGEDWRVVSITKNAVPESFPEHFQPSIPAQYVLEVPAGFADKNGIGVGDQVHFGQ